MARPGTWVRWFGRPGEGATLPGLSLVGPSIPPNATVTRTLITFDLWYDSTQGTYLDAGTFNAWGMTLTPSQTTAPNFPVDAWSITTPRWLWQDQLIFDVTEASTVAGSSNYVIRNEPFSRHTTVEAQWRNDTGANLYPWLLWQLDPNAFSQPFTLYCTAGVSMFVLSPP